LSPEHPPIGVHLADEIEPPELGVQLRAALDPAIRITTGKEPTVPADYAVLVAGRPTPELLEASAKLRAVVIPWAGLARKTRDLLLRYPKLTVHNLHHNAAATAELALALLLAAAKRVVPMDRALRAGDWRPRWAPQTALSLAGKTALVLGYGAIGRRVAAGCLGLGMSVVAVRRQASSGEWDGKVVLHPVRDLRALLPRADALLICLPLTSETEGLIGAAELALLPERAVLVNVGRGPIVDEAALYAALESGRLHSAGLDVWYRYPDDEASREHTLPASQPFHELDSVVLSPHRGGDNRETEEQWPEALAALLNAAARGEPIPNRVDLAAGY
jgi:phosphoglycerate dehydrogenase-like enzyme